MKLPSVIWFESVLEEFKSSPCRFICHASNTFNREWHNSDSGLLKGLKAQARIWLRKTKCKTVVVNDTDVLFYSKDTKDSPYLIPDDIMRALKIEFLTWLIKKLEK